VIFWVCVVKMKRDWCDFRGFCSRRIG